MKVASSTDPYVSKVGTEPNPKGVSLLFCNGAGSTREDAEKSASLISKALNNQIVTLFYNPTGINADEDKKSDHPDVKDLSKLFLDLINGEINRHVADGCERTAIRIKLFLHSHSGLIALDAIENLSTEDKCNLEIYSFGSVKMFPKSSGREVVNFVHENDLIAEGSSQIDQNPILFDFKQICVQVKAGMNRFLAIFKQAEQDLRNHLSPFRESYALEPAEVREEKDRRYAQIFLNPASDGQALMQDPLFQTRCKYYCSLFDDYDVVLLPGVPLDPNGSSTFEEFCRRDLKGVAMNALINHLFPTYTKSVFDTKFVSKF